MDIKSIINEDLNTVNVDKIELPESMQQQAQPEEKADTPKNDEKTTKLTLEQLSGMIVIGYNAISCAIYRKIEAGFDASLTGEEMQAIQEPLKLVLQQYDVEVTPVTALAIAVIGVNVGKIMQLQAYRQQKALEAAEVEQQNIMQNE